MAIKLFENILKRKKRVVISQEKYDELKSELEELKTVGRKVIADKLDLYRAEVTEDDGTALSEVLQEKEAMERKIIELTETLENAQINDRCEGGEEIGLGCKVTIASGRDSRTVKVVSAVESNPDEDKISESSPLGSALIGRKVGDKVKVKTPQGVNEWHVKKID